MVWEKLVAERSLMKIWGVYTGNKTVLTHVKDNPEKKIAQKPNNTKIARLHTQDKTEKSSALWGGGNEVGHNFKKISLLLTTKWLQKHTH